jgi:hypothetical protein
MSNKIVIANVRPFFEHALYGKHERYTQLWWRDLREKTAWEDLGIDGRIVLKWILKKWNGRHNS